MKLIHEAAQFLKLARKSLRRGEATREPLTILRFEWRGDTVECDWLIRAASLAERERTVQPAVEPQTQQAFRDALDLRQLVFESFPAVMQARLRMFRSNRNHQLELLMVGQVNRLDQSFEREPLLMTRARLSGFQFVLSDGVFVGPITTQVKEAP